MANDYRHHGATGNYLGGGGYGSMRDYEEYRGIEPGPRQSFRGVGPKNFSRTDERIREVVCERLDDDHDIDASGIDIEVANGEVTLSGDVDHPRTKRLAEDVAASVGCVTRVHNRLRCESR